MEPGTLTDTKKSQHSKVSMSQYLNQTLIYRKILRKRNLCFIRIEEVFFSD